LNQNCGPGSYNHFVITIVF